MLQLLLVVYASVSMRHVTHVAQCVGGRPGCHLTNSAVAQLLRQRPDPMRLPAVVTITSKATSQFIWRLRVAVVQLCVAATCTAIALERRRGVLNLLLHVHSIFDWNYSRYESSSGPAWPQTTQ